MRRAGFSLPELSVALTLAGVIATAAVGLFRGTERLARAHAERLAAAENLRIPAVVLRREIRFLEPASDLTAVAEDSLVLRAFRGSGVVCGTGGAVWVRYRGTRAPNPEKDSVLVLGAAGERVVALEASRRRDDGCSLRNGEALYGWRMAAAPAVGTPVLLFESGSYHLADDAVRYRRGRGGRQPLTAERIDARRSVLRALDARGRTTVEPSRITALGLRLAVRLRERGGGREFVAPAVRHRFALLNCPCATGVGGPGGAAGP